VYVFHAGYWGPHVGFYGGINYGGGYIGNGFAGGRWVGNSFQYNTAVTNVNTTVIHNTYNQTVVNNITVVKNTTVVQTSYAGGPGTRAVPNAQEMAVANQPHTLPTAVQVQHEATARANPELQASRNQGRPPVAATARPGALNGAGVTAAKPVGEPWHPATPPAVARNSSSPPHGQPNNGMNGNRPNGQPRATAMATRPNGMPAHANGGGRPGQPGQPQMHRPNGQQPPKADHNAKGNGSGKPEGSEHPERS
jgi:hypothetical protein